MKVDDLTMPGYKPNLSVGVSMAEVVGVTPDFKSCLIVPRDGMSRRVMKEVPMETITSPACLSISSQVVTPSSRGPRVDRELSQSLQNKISSTKRIVNNISHDLKVAQSETKKAKKVIDQVKGLKDKEEKSKNKISEELSVRKESYNLKLNRLEDKLKTRIKKLLKKVQESEQIIKKYDIGIEHLGVKQVFKL